MLPPLQEPPGLPCGPKRRSCRSLSPAFEISHGLMDGVIHSALSCVSAAHCVLTARPTGAAAVMADPGDDFTLSTPSAP